MTDEPEGTGSDRSQWTAAPQLSHIAAHAAVAFTRPARGSLLDCRRAADGRASVALKLVLDFLDCR
jgi:hypothetical protein